MPYTLGTAATAAGINKTTILRAIRTGKISAAKDDHGNWQIDPAELHRVYPPVAVTDAGNGAAPQDAMADALVSELRAVIADLRSDRDHWRDQAQRLAIAGPTRRSWWRVWG